MLISLKKMPSLKIMKSLLITDYKFNFKKVFHIQIVEVVPSFLRKEIVYYNFFNLKYINTLLHNTLCAKNCFQRIEDKINTIVQQIDSSLRLKSKITNHFWWFNQLYNRSHRLTDIWDIAQKNRLKILKTLKINKTRLKFVFFLPFCTKI